MVRIDLRYELLAIPPSGVALFEVTVSFFYYVCDGGIHFDFAILQVPGAGFEPARG